jgi:hypothetical protein
VLFLGVYHHLRMPQARLDALVNDLLDRTQKLFVVRTNQLPDFGHRIEDPGFILEYEHPRQEVGLLRVYRRAEAPA